jgi:hypothetical protein
MSSENGNGWRVIDVSIKDYRRVELAAFRLTDPVSTITGKNKAGKTGTLEGLLEGLKSGKMAGVDVVRHGADEALINVHLMDGDVHLYTTKSQDREGEWDFEVRDTPDGRKRKDGAAVLKRIVSAFVDLSALANTDGPGRIDMLLAALGKKAELDALNAEEKELRARREEKGTQRRDKAGELEGMKAPASDVPDEPVDTAKLLHQRHLMEQEKESRDRIIQAHGKRLDKLSEAVTREETIQADIIRLSADLKNVREWIASEQAAIAKEKKDLLHIPEVNFTEIDAQISGASAVNQAVADKNRYLTVAHGHAKISAAWDADTVLIQNVAKKKTELLASLDVPYPGVGVSEEHQDLTVDGSLWCNLSKAEKAAVTVALAAKISPDFRFGIVRDAAWFDAETEAMVDQIARENNFWILKEVPGDRDDSSIVIEDGVAVAGSAVTA